MVLENLPIEIYANAQIYISSDPQAPVMEI